MKKRVVTVTLNPAIDTTIFLQELKVGGLNRTRQVVQDVGGKGINVSKTLQALGETSIATGFLGRQDSDVVLRHLESKGILADFVLVEGAVRTNQKLVEAKGRVTEINEPGPDIAPAYLTLLEKKLKKYAQDGVLFVLAGSAPPGTGADLYQRLIRAVHQKGAKALLDADGELFAQGMLAVPDVVKPNQTELLEYFGQGMEESERESLHQLGRKLLSQGVKTAMISCGAEGALFLQATDNGCDRIDCPALPVQTASTVGAGDAMTAGYCYAYLKGMAMTEMVRWCMAVSAGAVTTEGTRPPDKKLVEQLLPQVQSRSGLSL